MGLENGKLTCISNGTSPAYFKSAETQASLSIHFHSPNHITNVSFTQQFG